MSGKFPVSPSDVRKWELKDIIRANAALDALEAHIAYEQEKGK